MATATKENADNNLNAIMPDINHPHPYRRPFLLAFGLLIACMLSAALLAGRLAGRYAAQNNPPEPIANGDFPTVPVWVFSADSEVLASPLYADNRLYIRSESSIYALDPQTGEQLWRADSPGDTPLSVAPVSAGGRLYVPEALSQMAAFDSSTGELIWRSADIDFRYGSPKTNGIELIDIDQACLYVVRNNLQLTCHAPDNGVEIWSVPIPERIATFLTTDQGIVYLAADHSVRGYDQENGEEVFRRDYPEFVGPILADNGDIFIARQGLEVLGMTIESGKILWRVQIAQLDPEFIDFVYFLTVIDGRVYASGEQLQAIERRDGKALWESEIYDDLETPVLLNDRIYVRDTYTNLYALAADTGEQTGHLVVQSNNYSRFDPPRSPIAAGELLIVPFGDERVFAYRP